MEKPNKLSFLKRYPIIPSIFFILFAWMLLVLITQWKGYKTSPPKSPNIEQSP